MRVAMVTPVISRTYVFLAELLIFGVQHVFETGLGIATVKDPSKATVAVGIATVVGLIDAVPGAYRCYTPLRTIAMTTCSVAPSAMGVMGMEGTVTWPALLVGPTGQSDYLFDKIFSPIDTITSQTA